MRIGRWANVLPMGLALFLGLDALGQQPQLTLGERGKQLMEEKFEHAELSQGAPQGWSRNAGHLEVVDGRLQVHEVAADKHAAAFRYRMPVQDCVVAFDFRLGGAKFLHCGFDPAPGELKKKGHLFSVILKPDGWSVVEHNDKSDPKSKTKVLANEKINLDPEKTYSIAIETRGDRVVAHIAGIGSIEATSQDFHVKKPGLVFRVAGDEKGVASLDNVRVWELK